MLKFHETDRNSFVEMTKYLEKGKNASHQQFAQQHQTYQ